MVLEHSWHDPITATGGAGGDGGEASSLMARIWITLGLLIVYRIGTYVPLPNVDPVAFQQLLELRKFEADGILYMFGPGPLGRLSVFALSVVPYLLAVILMQVAANLPPALAALRQQDSAGQEKMRWRVKFAALLFCIPLAYGLSLGLESMSLAGFPLVSEPGPIFRLTTVATLTAGSMLLIWLAEEITRRGIGNGIELIIFAGIVANLPLGLATMLEFGRTGVLSGTYFLLALVMMIALTALIVFVERAKRVLLVVYSKSQSGTRLLGGSTSRITLKPNNSGIVAPVLASVLLAVPLTAALLPGGIGRGEWLGELTDRMVVGQPVYLAVYAGLIAIFVFLCSRTLFDPVRIAESLKQHTGTIPGIRPGRNTAEHIDYIQTRLSVAGGAYLVLVCLIPDLLIAHNGRSFHLGGTSLFILVVVALDMIRRIRDEQLALRS